MGSGGAPGSVVLKREFGIAGGRIGLEFSTEELDGGLKLGRLAEENFVVRVSNNAVNCSTEGGVED